MDDPRGSKVFYRNQRRPYPIMTRGEGVYLYDDAGKRYIDAVSGTGVAAMGHGVQEITDAMAEQAQALGYAYGRQVTTQVQIDLAGEVLDFCPPGMAKVFFVSGGSEATEAAIKLARQFFFETGQPGRYKVIGRAGSFHGNTLGALAVSGRPEWRDSFGPLLVPMPQARASYCYRCPFGETYPACGVVCATEIEDIIEQEGPETVAAVIADPLVGPTLGAFAPPNEYFPRVREICDAYGVLLIVDEVLTGFGRTGRNFGIDHWAVAPDLLTCGKGMSGGYAPLGAVVVHERISEAIREGSGLVTHGHTYGGHPVACAAGLAAIRYLRRHDLVSRAAESGAYLIERTIERLGPLNAVGEIRGRGLYLGIELVRDKATRAPFPRAANVAGRLEDHALSIGMTLIAGSGGADGAGGDCAILAPPLVVTREEIAEIVEILRATIVDVTSDGSSGELTRAAERGRGVG